MLSILKRFLFTFLFLNVYAVAIGIEESSSDLSRSPSFVIPFVQTHFNKMRFLELYNEHNPGNPLYVDISTVPEHLREKALAYKCWEALFALKMKYQKQQDLEKCRYLYLDMANLFLASGVFPQPYEEKNKLVEYKKFQISLLRSILAKVSNQHDRQDKLLKWSHISHAKLCMDYVRRYPSTTHRVSFLNSAYQALKSASELKTTQTSYLLLATLIVDLKFIPEGLTEAQAIQEAKNALMQAGQRKEGSKECSKEGSKKGSKPKEREFFVISYAKPTYLRDLNPVAKAQLREFSRIPQVLNLNNTIEEPSLFPHSSDGDVREENTEVENLNLGIEVPTREKVAQSLEGFRSDFADIIEDDSLKDFDYQTLTIPTINSTEELSIRREILNPVREHDTDQFLIDGKIFERKNVSGRGMRCFFNAVGLNPLDQIAKLREQSQNPAIRYMIANEIVSAARTPNQIPLEVKKAINYTLYQAQSQSIDDGEIVRARLLARQNSNANLTDINLLPENLRKLKNTQDEILEELRQRALSLEAFYAFVNYHIGNEEMMVALHDLQNQHSKNYTSVDAIALSNNIGIKIYQPHDPGELRLVHQFIPANAREIAYLYHDALHFQALFPIVEKEMTSSSISKPIKEDDSSDSHSYEMDVESLTSKDRQFIQELEAVLKENGCDLEDLCPESDSDFIELVDKHFGEDTTLVIHIYDMDGNKISSLTLDSATPPSSVYHLYVKGENENWTWFQSQRQRTAQVNKSKILKDSIPDMATLRSLYPSVNQVERVRDYDEDLIRKILYCSEHLKMRNTAIGALEWVNMDQRRISEILIKNQIRQKNPLPPEVVEAVVGSYHDFFDAIQSDEVILNDVIRAVAQKFNLNPHYVLKRYRPLMIQGKDGEPQDDRDEKVKQVVKLYLEGKKFLDIQQDTNFTYQTIVKIITEHVEKGKRRHCLDLDVSKKTFTKAEVEKLVIAKFNELKTLNKDKPVAILHVVNALKDQKIGYKTVDRILKGKNLIQTNIKAKHLNTSQIEALKADWEKMRKTLKTGEVQQTYKTLAQKHKVSEQQVKDVLKSQSYKSDRVHVRSDLRQLIIDAYGELSLEQKVRPASHIKAKLASHKVNAHFIHDVLEEAGHYKWNGKHGKAAKNLVAHKELENSKTGKRSIVVDEEDTDAPKSKKARHVDLSQTTSDSSQSG